MRTWVDLLLHHAATRPTQVAFRFLDSAGETTITYGELDRRARAIAQAVKERVPKGERLLLLYPPGLDYLAGLFGCFYAGVIAVPAYPPQFNRPWSRIIGLAQDCTAVGGLATSAIVERVDASALGSATTWIATDTDGVGDASAWQHPGTTSEDIAFLQYTSGSTSLPKGVMLSHGNLIANSESIKKRIGNGLDSVSVTWLPPYHDMGLIGGLLQAVYCGHQSVMMSPLSFLQKPLRWLQAISRYRGTYSGSPNFGYDLCVRRTTEAERAALDLSSWHSAFNGAERVRPETLERFARAFAVSKFDPTAFSPCYGLAEATLCVSYHCDRKPWIDASPNVSPGHEKQAANVPRSLVGCGPLVPDVIVRTVDPETRRPVPDGEIGEIWVHGENVGLGYWNKPEQTAQTFGAEIEGEPGMKYLRTGDLGFLHASGELAIAGRLKDLVILLGRNHYPEDIERTAERAHPAIRPSCAAAFSVEIGGAEKLVLVADAEKDVDWTIEEVAASVREAIALEHDAQLHTLVLVKPGGVPKTSSGKVQRQLTRRMFLEGSLVQKGVDVVPGDMAAEGVAGGATAGGDTELLAQIAQIMAGVLSIDSIGYDEDFFALGGHSLLATQLLSRLREQLRVDVPLRTVFEAPTARRLAARVQGLPRVEFPPIEPIPRDQDIVLSYAQERMWFLHQFSPKSSAYNVAGALMLRGAIEPAAMVAALREIVRRHEVLRTRYVVKDGRPTGVVGSYAEWTCDVVDLGGYADPEGEAFRRGNELARRPYDIARDPVFRAALYRVSRDKTLLALSIHHIAADGWSMSILIREGFAIYAGLLGKRPPALPDTKLQYADYAAWQRKLLGGSALKPQEDYWKGRLSGLPEFVSFPSDRPRPMRQSVVGALEPINLPGHLIVGIRELGARTGATPFMVMYAAFTILMQRYTQQTDLPIGVPIANRNWLASEGFIGTLVNTLVFRSNVDGDPTFSELLERVRETALEAYAHQDVPFERLVELLQPRRSEGHSPLFQVMFDAQNVDVPSGEVAGLRVEATRLHRGAAQFDLAFSIFDLGASQLSAVEYATALYDAETIKHLIAQYVAILEWAVADPSRRTSTIPLLSARERQTLLESWNATHVAYDPSPTYRQFERKADEAAKRGGALAIRYEGREVSYDALNRLSNRLAHRLRELGAGPGSLVGICMDRRPEMVAAMLGTQKAGAAYVPIDPAYPEERVAMILEDAKPKVLLCDEALAARFRGGPAAVVSVDEALAGKANDPALERNLDVDAGGEDPVYVLFTSGSTGRPKGVEIPHRALSNFLSSMAKQPGMDHKDRLLALTTISFDISGLELYLPLVTGAAIELVSRVTAADPSLLRAAFERTKPTVMQATPSTWRMLVDAGFKGSTDLKILCGGEALPSDLSKALLERCAQLWNVYGPTETTIWSTCHRITPDDETVTIGRPIDNTTIYVLDERKELVPVGVPGELWIGGDGVALGYLGRADLTADRFVTDPFSRKPGAKMYRTGDGARFRRDGTIEYIGRLDGQVKLRGHRIELGEIEVALRKHPSVAEVAVAVHGKDARDQRLVAHVVPAAGATVSSTDLRAHLRASLPEYMVPAIYAPIDRLPLTPNGKLDRKALPAPPERLDDGPRGRAPKGPVEEALARLWEETLGVTNIAATDDFFAIGGHSMLAVRLFAKIKASMGVELPLQSLFQASTIEALAELVPQSVHLPNASTALAPIQPNGSKPPIFWVDALGVGGGGGLLRYRRLAQLLGSDQPSYGLLEPQRAHASVEAWAAYSIETMKTIQPRGPYHLAGYCLGGNLAYEMARQLTAAGESVAMVALFESRTSSATARANTSTFEYARSVAQSAGHSLLRVARLSQQEKVAGAKAQLSRLGRIAAARMGVPLGGAGGGAVVDVDFEWMNVAHYSDLEMAKQHWTLLTTHAWGTYEGPVNLFRVHRRGFLPRLPALGWELLCPNVTVDVVPGWHEVMLEEPYVGELAERFGARLRERRTNGALPAHGDAAPGPGGRRGATGVSP